MSETKSKAKHTPGPWAITTTTLADGTQSHTIETRGSSGVTVEEVVALIPRNNPKGAANARLIAAAPDLLRVLMGIVMETEQVEDGVFHFWVTAEELDAARAAIAKATTT